MAKKKFYVVWVGKKPGVYHSWPDCERQIKGVAGARYKSFSTLDQAEKALSESVEDYISYNKPKEIKKVDFRSLKKGPILKSICVDAACAGNPGVLEYRGVFTETQTPFFAKQPLKKGTII